MATGIGLAPRLLFLDGDYVQFFDVADAGNPIKLFTHGAPPKDHAPGELYWVTWTFPNSFDWDPDRQILTQVSHTTSVNDPHHSGGWRTTAVEAWKLTDAGMSSMSWRQIFPDRYVDIEIRTRIEGDEVRAVMQGSNEERFSLSPVR